MVLEATVICIDNSEYSRNGDYIPSRLDVQFDATNIICGSKANLNPENAVGLVTSAGDRVIVRVTPTQDIGKILQGSHDIVPEGECDVIRAVQTAQLALKHRMNKNQKQRIVLFVGSPLKASERLLEKLGRVLKKNNIALDIISLGETHVNSPKLSKLYNTVNNNGTSHFLECPVESSRSLSDVLMLSPIVRDADPRTLNSLSTRLVGLEGQDNPVNVDVGVDPRLDPELYMALQISLLEERERQTRTIETGGEANTLTETPIVVQPEADNPVAQIQSMEGIDDELRQALLLSLEDFYQPTSEQTTEPPSGLADPDAVVPVSSLEITQGDNISVIHPLPTLSDTVMEVERTPPGDQERVPKTETNEPPSEEQRTEKDKEEKPYQERQTPKKD